MPGRDRFPGHRGNVTGYLLKLVRESIPRSQERLSVELGVDRATVQSWESGRRPFPAVSLGQTVEIRHRLGRLGADPRLLSLLDDAAEADHLLWAIVDGDPAQADLDTHPLGGTVLTHLVTELVAWAVVGQEPAALSDRLRRGVVRRGPVADRPGLDGAERSAFFGNLRILAERSGARDPTHLLLHRQACFLASLDPSGNPPHWLRSAGGLIRSVAGAGSWSPLWPDARSVATSMAKQGDPQMLRDFIAGAHPDDSCELAGLNYSAYWVGEFGRRLHDDSFMPEPTSEWRGGRLFRHLVDRLHPAHPFVDLNIHNLWALLIARPGLPLGQTGTGRTLVAKAEEVLDVGDISAQSRQELTSIRYGLRMCGLATSQGRDG